MNHVSEALQLLAQIQQVRLTGDDAAERALALQLEAILPTYSPGERAEIEAMIRQLQIRARSSS